MDSSLPLSIRLLQNKNTHVARQTADLTAHSEIEFQMLEKYHSCLGALNAGTRTLRSPYSHSER